jgi:hypothetical protein
MLVVCGNTRLYSKREGNVSFHFREQDAKDFLFLLYVSRCDFEAKKKSTAVPS